jgi:hypothetical protein
MDIEDKAEQWEGYAVGSKFYQEATQMDPKNELVPELLITNTILTTRLLRIHAALLQIMRESVPDFEKRYIAALFPPDQTEASKLLEELAETAHKLAQAYRGRGRV